jgi:mono/diheme cytochrome c family protein
MPIYKQATKLILTGFMAVVLAVILFVSFSWRTQAASLAQSASEGKQLFDSMCVACHTIGGGQLVGPDLQGVTARRDLSWIKNFILAPDQMIASGDPTATQLLAENNNVPMPNLGVTESEVDSLIAYLEDPDQVGQSESTAPQAVQLPTGNATLGLDLFTGAQPLQHGGPACIACHSIAGTASLGGGNLGPDLTQVFQRYGDAGLASALNSIPFPTMQGIFLNQPLTPEEQANLHALFQWSQTNAPAPPPTNAYTNLFLGAGVGGALALFGVMVFFWPRQRKSLAEKLREGQE